MEPTFEIWNEDCVAGMAERLDLHLNHVKDFVFDLVGRARP